MIMSYEIDGKNKNNPSTGTVTILSSTDYNKPYTLQVQTTTITSNTHDKELSSYNIFSYNVKYSNIFNDDTIIQSDGVFFKNLRLLNDNKYVHNKDNNNAEIINNTNKYNQILQNIPRQLSIKYPIYVNYHFQAYKPFEGIPISIIFDNHMVQSHMSSSGIYQSILNFNNMKSYSINTEDSSLLSCQNYLQSYINNIINRSSPINNNAIVAVRQMPIQNYNQQTIDNSAIINSFNKGSSTVNPNTDINKKYNNNNRKINYINKNKRIKNRRLYRTKHDEVLQHKPSILNNEIRNDLLPEKNKKHLYKSEKSDSPTPNLEHVPNFTHLTNEKLCEYAYMLSKNQTGSRLLQNRIDRDSSLADMIFKKVC
jgi:hypothetical protein